MSLVKLLQKFAVKPETNNTLNYLDLTIINEVLKFEIYRKVTHTDLIKSSVNQILISIYNGTILH